MRRLAGIQHGVAFPALEDPEVVLFPPDTCLDGYKLLSDRSLAVNRLIYTRYQGWQKHVMKGFLLYTVLPKKVIYTRVLYRQRKCYTAKGSQSTTVFCCQRRSSTAMSKEVHLRTRFSTAK